MPSAAWLRESAPSTAHWTVLMPNSFTACRCSGLPSWKSRKKIRLLTALRLTSDTFVTVLFIDQAACAHYCPRGSSGRSQTCRVPCLLSRYIMILTCCDQLSYGGEGASIVKSLETRPRRTDPRGPPHKGKTKCHIMLMNSLVHHAVEAGMHSLPLRRWECSPCLRCCRPRWRIPIARSG